MSISQFLARPRIIYFHEWVEGTPLSLNLHPYNLFFQSDYVKRKIANYKFFRGDLKLKLVFNSTQFNYGLVQVSFVPRIRAIDSYPKPIATVDPQWELIGFSQNPVVYADLNENSSVELAIPFFYPFNYMDLQTGNFLDLAKVHIREMPGGLMKASSSATSTVDITMFAWIENAELAGPTMFTLESAKLPATEAKGLKAANVDEYEDDSVSTLSYAVSKATGALSSVPVIGPYAMATSLGAKKFGDVAKYFGFSRPAQVSDMHTLKPRSQAPMANVLGSDTVYKLTYDPKQETTVDTTVTGLPNNDDMLLSTIFGRESYIGSLSWGMSDDYGDTIGFVRVSPMVMMQHYHYSPHETFIPTVMSSLAFGSFPFQHWSGSIDYRAKIVASKYHKGRVRITYDPLGNAPGSDEHNPLCTYIVDLDTCREIEFRVSWCSNQPYLDMPLRDYGAQNGTPVTDSQDPRCNGTVFFEVINQLSAPSSTADVWIHLFHKGGPDYEVFNPKPSSPDLWGPGMVTNLPMLPEASVLPSTEVVTLMDLESAGFSTCGDDQVVQLIGEPDVDVMNKKGLIFHGDPVNSLRQLLKRYEFHTVAHSSRSQDSSEELTFVSVLHPYPTYNNFTNRKEGFSSPTYPTRRNGCPTSLLAYFTSAYAGYRGGLRFKAFVKVQSGYAGITRVFRTSGPTAANLATIDGSNFEVASNGSNEALTLGTRYGGYGGASGCISVDSRTEPVIEFELPYYSRYRFFDVPIPEFTQTDDSFPPTYDQVAEQNFTTFTECHTGHAAGNIQCTQRFYCAAAEDYNLIWYLGCPFLCLQDY